ncbi:hypothetical protein GTW71_05410, partial [Streptomyces sp. SID6041]|nr:hypothetical protein [Streptomyces sp. SID6041]
MRRTPLRAGARRTRRRPIPRACQHPSCTHPTQPPRTAVKGDTAMAVTVSLVALFGLVLFFLLRS